MTTRQRKLRSVFVLWIVCLIVAGILTEVTYGTLRPGGRAHWAVTISQFIESTGLGAIAVPLMYASAIVVWIVPIYLFSLYFSKDPETR